jgi:hypothetical protein
MARFAIGSRLRKPGVASPEQWDRIRITDGVELHVRKPASRDTQNIIDRLMEFIRQNNIP